MCSTKKMGLNTREIPFCSTFHFGKFQHEALGFYSVNCCLKPLTRCLLRTSGTNLAAPCLPLFSSYHILTSSDAPKNEFSLLIDSLTTKEDHNDIFYCPVL